MARPLSATEFGILARFQTLDISSAPELAAQLKVAEVRSESPGFLDLELTDRSVSSIQFSAEFPLDGWYDDADGGLVWLLLHVAFPDGRIDSLERLRPDGEPIINYEPDPALVRVAKRAVHAPGEGAHFDMRHGWRRIV